MSYIGQCWPSRELSQTALLEADLVSEHLADFLVLHVTYIIVLTPDEGRLTFAWGDHWPSLADSSRVWALVSFLLGALRSFWLYEYKLSRFLFIQEHCNPDLLRAAEATKALTRIICAVAPCCLLADLGLLDAPA